MEEEGGDDVFAAFGAIDCVDEEPELTEEEERARDEERGFTGAELATAQRVLEQLRARPEVAKRREYHELRAVGSDLFLKSFGSKFYGGSWSREEYRNSKEQRVLLRKRRSAKKQLDAWHRDKVQLRQERIAALRKLEMSSFVPSQPAILDAGDGLVKVEPSAIEAEELEKTGVAPDAIVVVKDAYMFPHSCYCCKKRFFERHHFYDRMCPDCAKLNWEKRNARVDLTNARVAVVTGARVKIGFQTALKLLRDGCVVIATTRFPHDAAERYSKLEDFEDFRARLHIYGLDMRDLGAVEAFCAFVDKKFDHLDIIINNAAQTVRRPPAYYKHLMPTELQAPPEQLEDVLLRPFAEAPSLKFQSDRSSSTARDMLCAEESTSGAQSVDSAALLNPSAALSQAVLLEGEEEYDERQFPTGKFDVEGQQIDLREKNSWTMKAAEVPTIELVEVHAINALAPFIINSKLKHMLEKSPHSQRFVVNVSAMEAKFYRHKDDRHPHTNMAKAGLNMLTRTSAVDFLQSQIFMNSVDTGWINDENPYDKTQENLQRGFQTPIDEVDAAARILAPIYDGITTGECAHGKFYKDYWETEW